MTKSEVTKIDFSDPEPENFEDKCIWNMVGAIGLLMAYAGLESIVLDHRDKSNIDHMTLQNVGDHKLRFTCKMKKKDISDITDITGCRSIILIPEED